MRVFCKLYRSYLQAILLRRRTIYVGSEVVFRSNAVMYDRDNFRGLLL